MQTEKYRLLQTTHTPTSTDTISGFFPYRSAYSQHESVLCVPDTFLRQIYKPDSVIMQTYTDSTLTYADKKPRKSLRPHRSVSVRNSPHNAIIIYLAFLSPGRSLRHPATALRWNFQFPIHNFQSNLNVSITKQFLENHDIENSMKIEHWTLNISIARRWGTALHSSKDLAVSPPHIT
jgi:hypothetical protein